MRTSSVFTPSKVRTSPWTCLAAMALAAACNKQPQAEKPAPLPPTAVAPLPAPPAATEVETVPSAPDPKASITGTIILPGARKKEVSKGDTLFLVARRAGGAPGPGSMLAVQKLQADSFPLPFSLSARDTMIPGVPFEGEINLTVRVDKDGDPMTRRKGEVFGQLNGVKVGSADVKVPLDTVQGEDTTLGGPGGPAGVGVPGASPHGLPPGHP